jgi:hypothetical protein
VSGDILSIDVSSELETLCEAQLRGVWQVPAELVRLALRVGAEVVSVDRRKRGFVVAWDGPLIGGEVLGDLRSALDVIGSPEDRQRAIAAIEASETEALLWAAGLRGSEIRITVTGGREQWRFERWRRRSRLVRSRVPEGPNTVEIEWRCRGLDRRRAMRWLAIAARFAPAQVLVDGSPGPRHFAGGLFHVRVEDPVPCRLGLTRTGDDPVLWLLRDGVVSTRATIPGYPPFEAAVELRGLVPPGASSADMRRAVTPYLDELVDRAVWMMVEVSDKLSEMTPGDADRICLLLLRAARKGLRASDIRRLDLVSNAADGRRRLSVEEIRELAERSGGVLSAIDRSEQAGEGLVDPESTLIASTEIRDLLTELAGIRFQSPTLRRRGFPSRVADGFRAMTDRLVRRWRGLFVGPDVPLHELRPQEKAVLTALRTTMSPVGVHFCEGRGSAGETHRGVVVPRSGPVMTAGAELVASEPVWLYPLLLALETGSEVPNELRESWLAASGGKLIQITPNGEKSVRQ